MKNKQLLFHFTFNCYLLFQIFGKKIQLNEAIYIIWIELIFILFFDYLTAFLCNDLSSKKRSFSRLKDMFSRKNYIPPYATIIIFILYFSVTIFTFTLDNMSSSLAVITKTSIFMLISYLASFLVNITTNYKSISITSTFSNSCLGKYIIYLMLVGFPLLLIKWITHVDGIEELKYLPHYQTLAIFFIAIKTFVDLLPDYKI